MGGKCVRLVQGEFTRKTVYSDNPVEIALRWKEKGAEWLHVVDLDGARTGESQNTPVVFEIAEKTGINVQLGGGIRSMAAVEMFLEKGIRRMVLGTSAVKNPGFVKKALKKYGDRIAIGIDAKNGVAAIDGWARSSGLAAVDFARRVEALGARTIIYTDISTDGMLSGPNFSAIRRMVEAVGMEVIASGGVSSLEDVQKLKSLGISGVIIGKALYTGNIELGAVLELSR